ncbi:MAG: esterase family protein [Dysgonamonadaceae bacterium]|jgi:S-formylglutathione hydrolase FrmB|nr:esterase family protein [Dysgonamonadaceae bacterium]
MISRSSILLVFCLFTLSTYSAKTDTITTYSQVMQKEIEAVVITPDDYSVTEAFPVIYLLHGYGGSSVKDWPAKEKGTAALSDLYHVIIVCPDGGIGSWYFDSPVDKNSQYETYVAKELVQLIDSKYKTIASPKGRGITGLSMGGHGALYLAFRHQDVFGTAGSMSGGVDIRPFPNNWDIIKRLGSYASNPENWEKNTVINMVHLLTPNSLALIIDCGSEDFFYKVNCRLHEKLLERNIPHDFISRPGGHNWDYWKNAVKYQFLFMSSYFEKNNDGKMGK